MRKIFEIIGPKNPFIIFSILILMVSMTHLATSNYYHISDSVRLLKLEPFKQTDDSRCGPATLKMILKYYGVEVSEERLVTLTNHTYEKGCKNSDMKSVLEKFGLKTYQKQNSKISDIKYWLDRKVPVIVDWFSPGVNINKSDLPNGHSSIVIGLTKTHIYLLDPEDGGTRKLLISDFMRVWFDWEDTEHIIDPNKMNIRYMLVGY